MSVRCFAWGLLITASAWAIGCGSGRPPVYPVQGQVRWKKQIPEGAHVVFHPVGKTGADVVRPTGQVDRDGKFVSPFNINRKPDDAASDLKHYL